MDLTAEDFLGDYPREFIETGTDWTEPCITVENVLTVMKAFAKYHVDKALSAAADAAEIVVVEYERQPNGEWFSDIISRQGEEVDAGEEDVYYQVDKDAILNAYSESKIK